MILLKFFHLKTLKKMWRLMTSNAIFSKKKKDIYPIQAIVEHDVVPIPVGVALSSSSVSGC